MVCNNNPATALFLKGKCIIPAHITGCPLERPFTHYQVVFSAQLLEVKDLKTELPHFIGTGITSLVIVKGCRIPISNA
jgi:hypothetical protein